MRDFAFGPAVLAGFDLLRRRPWTTLGLALIGVAVSLAGEVISVVSRHFGMGTVSGQGAPAAIDLVSALLILLVLTLGVAVIGTGVMRVVSNAEPDRLWPALVGDGARMFLLSLLIMPALFFVMLATALGAAFMAQGWPSGAAAAFLPILFTVIAATLVLALASRLWLGGPITIRDRRLRFLASWRLTRGRSWKVLGVFTVTLIFAVVVGLLGTAGLAKVKSGLELGDSSVQDPSLIVALMGIVQPLGLGYALLQGLLLGFAVVMQAAPAAYIHRRLAGDPVLDQAAVFD